VFFAIPFYKNTDYLKETLQSLIIQNDPDWSAIVLDDSVDPVETIKASHYVTGLNDSRIRYLRNPKNLGMAANWNQALDLAKEDELSVILHADDRLLPDYVSTMKALAAKHPTASAYFCKSEIIGSDGNPVFSFADFYKKLLVPSVPEINLSGVNGIDKLISGNFIFCPSICYRMSRVNTARFNTDLRMVIDFDFILRLLKNNGVLVGSYRHSLFQYRRHLDNTTVALTRNLSRFHEEIKLYRELSTWLKSKNEIKLARRAKSMRVVKLNLSFQILKSLFKLRVKELRQESQLLLELLKDDSHA
jgi:glycosyltransferase involved in cell wall biosynthesis